MKVKNRLITILLIFLSALISTAAAIILTASNSTVANAETVTNQTYKYKLDVTGTALDSVYLYGNVDSTTAESMTVSNGVIFNFAPTVLEVNIKAYIGNPRYYTYHSVTRMNLAGTANYVDETEHNNRYNYSIQTVIYELPELSSGYYTITIDNYTQYAMSGHNEKVEESTRFSFCVDTQSPVISGASSKEIIYTNSISIYASDSISGVENLYVKEPSSSSYKAVGTTSYKAGDGDLNGLYSFYAIDIAKNKSQTYYVYLDTVKPTITLTGVSNTGFTQTSVVVNINDSGSGCSTAEYVRTLTGSYSTNPNTSFADGLIVFSEGNYYFEVTDKAGNSTNVKFTIDKSAPTLSLSGVSDGGFTNKTVSASWSTTINGVGSQRMNSSDILTVRYSRSTTSNFPASATTTYSSGTSLSEEGNYLITITDITGNSTSYKCTIDKSAPTLTLSGVSDGGFTNTDVSANWDTTAGGVGTQLSNNNDVLTVKYSRLGGLVFPTSADFLYERRTALSEEGNYLIIIMDSSGNSSSYKFTIDITIPEIIADVQEYTNTKIIFEVTDLHSITIEYRFNNGVIQSEDSTYLAIEATEENFGVWQIRAIDIAGNATEWKTAKLYIRSNFGNSENVKNEYKTAVYYTVTLSEKNFPDIAGRYTFSSYDAALQFAIQKEWDYRVVTLSTGWSYVNISQESVTQIYTSREELDKAVNKYASANVSNRQIMGSNGGNVSNPTDESGVTRPDALTEQNLELPDMLSKYSGLPLYFLAHDFAFSTPIAGVTGNKSTLVFSYISDGVSVFDGKEMILTYGDSISALLDAQGAWKQGYYLVIERDLCGNEERYIVYIDTEKPMLSATVQLGNGESNVIEFSQAYADEYENVMLYLGLGIEKILDNIDEYIMLTLDGRGLNKVSYVQGDEIPYLSYENGYYGKYVITVYDRSLNILTFTVTIAGAAPSVTHSSLTNETRLRLTIDVPDSNNAITNINIYKVSYTGERAKMSTDDDGTPITAETLVYILRTGGKYVVEIQDIFGRVVESDALFYMKGLPSGVLSGVRENGITKNTVTFQYANTNDILVYIYKDGDWVAADNRATITERSGYNYATIEATEENSYQYKIFLYASSDMNLFVEYIFEIDSVPPTVEIMTDEGEIASGTVTRLPFRVTWTEFGITAYYYNRNSTLGELSKARYTKDYIITTAGTFVFEVYDEAGNSITFEVTVDNSVSYTLEGDYSILEDGSYISKKSLTLTVTERTALWQCDSSNGISPMNGQVLTTDGTYSYVIQDMYGNELKITLIIDNLPPVPVIKTEDEDALDMNSSTNQAFTVSCEEANVSISYSTDGRSYSAYDGKLLDEELVYYFRLTDRMNNMVSFKIEIDRTVKYSLNGTYLEIEGGVTARSLTLTIGEDYKTFTAKSNNGVTVELGKRITEEGTYSIEITDLTGNTVYFIIVIDLTPPTPIIETLEGDLIEPNGSTNQAFKVYCDEPGISLYWSKRDGGYTFYEGDTFSEIGKYYFRLMDALGNELIFTVEIDGDVKFSIDGKYTLDDEGRYVSNTWLAVNVEEECTRFDVQTDSGRIFGAGERVTLEGVYTVTIYDTANNAVEIVLVIDKTPATPVIQTADGQEVEANGITNESFIVSCLETGATIEYSQNNKSFSKYDGSAIAEARIWYFKLTDLAGNIYDFTVELDSGVEFMVNGTYKIDGLGQYVSKNALSITLEENVVVFEVTSNNGITFTAGERIEIEGIYRVFIKDSANNSIEIVLVIDKSAPEPIIITTDDETLSMNGKTNQNFKIDCNESDVTIMWGEKSGEYAAYDGREFTAAKKYYFKLTDFIGNEITFTVEIERSVDYTIKGTYKEYSGYGYATATGVALIIDEEYSSFEVTSNNDIDIVLGERITAEGIYNVVIVDMVGNRVEFVIEVDYTAPVITLSGVDPGGITGDNVVVKVNDFETAYYTVSGVEGNISITDEIGLSDANKYTVIAVDRAGNRTTVTFTIDKSVDVDVFPEIISGQITTSAINVKVNERMNEIILMKGNQLVSFNGGTIAEAGVYNLKITDMYGNTVSYSWTIVPETAKAYDFNFPSDYRVSVSRDGAIVSDAVIGNTVVLSESGVYQVVFDNGTTKYSVKLTVDAVAPTVEITQEKTQVIISNPSKENVTLTLTKDGETVNYELGDVITATGDYTLTVTDAYGNMTVYTFSLHYINTFGIVVIAIACVIVVTIIIAAIVMRRKQGVR